jgi:hypothetical protein
MLSLLEIQKKRNISTSAFSDTVEDGSVDFLEDETLIRNEVILDDWQLVTQVVTNAQLKVKENSSPWGDLDVRKNFFPQSSQLSFGDYEINKDCYIVSFDNEPEDTELQELLGKLTNIELNNLVWEMETNVKGPTKAVLLAVKSLVIILYKFDVYPTRISPTVEAGLCLTFKTQNHIMYFEMYNDGDIGYIIENLKYKNEIKNVDLDIDFDDEVQHILDFHDNY